jgi:Ca2+-binding RTX toxin-like protein
MVSGTKSDDVLTGDAGDNRLDGLDGNDRLSGLGGDDVLVGGAGADILNGGDGIDLASYYTSVAAVNVDLVNHTASGGEAQGDTLIGIEDLEGSDWHDVLTGDGGDNWLYGLDGNDRLLGGNGNDVLIGGAGADVLDGGNGYNTALYAGSARGVSVDLAQGRAAYGDADGDTLNGITDVVGSDFADTLIGDEAGNYLYGEAGADILVGNAGDDLLSGGAGADALYGGTGENAASYGGSSSAVAVNLATGTLGAGDAEGDKLYQISDLIGSDFNDFLTGDAGNNWFSGAAGGDLLAGGNGDDTLRGREGSDTLMGEGGDDVLSGGAGADKLYGGDGINTASYSDSSSGVAVNLATGVSGAGDAQGDKLYQITDLIGSDFNDFLTGDAGGNWLFGGDGKDLLAGGNGNDWLTAGEGADTLLGEAGNDLLEGGAGADTLYGGAGFNTASYASSGSAVAVNLATGVLGAGDAEGDRLYQITDLMGSDFNDFLTGDAGSNWLSGGAGSDLLSGGDGDDVLEGGAGADSLFGGAGFNATSYFGSASAISVNLATGVLGGGDAVGDKLYQITDVIGSNFNDYLTGDGSSNWLYGGAGGDLLSGGTGADLLEGGSGADVLAGGSGADLFLYQDIADSGLTAATRDRIADFLWGGDQIDLSKIDANTAVGGDQAFKFIGTAGFSGGGGQLRYFAEAGVLVVAGDVNGDRQADFTIAVETSAKSLSASDFVL